MATKKGMTTSLPDEIYETMYGLAYCDKVLSPASVTYSVWEIEIDMRKYGVDYNDYELKSAILFLINAGRVTSNPLPTEKNLRTVNLTREV